MIKFKVVKILGVVFNVLAKPQKEVTSLTDGPYTIGLCDGLDDNIHVSNDIRLHAMKRTFAHEWSHGIAEVNGVSQSLDPAIAEVIAQSTANALLELIDQPEVMKFLMAKPKNGKPKRP